ncbi:MAG: WD40/YVTN/BNR-like repeat-containing protein [Acidimicrobiales bacterium]
MNNMSAIDLLEAANPEPDGSTYSVDDAWSSFQLHQSTRNRSLLATRTLARKGANAIPRRRLIPLALAAALVVALVVALGTHIVGGQSPHANAANESQLPAWSLLSDTGPAAFASTSTSPQGYNDLTCPTNQVCYMESQVPQSSAMTAYQSTDGGLNWSMLTIPAGLTLDTQFSCYSADDCMIGARLVTYQSNAGQVLLSTTDGGPSWTSLPVPMASITGSDAALDPSIADSTGTIYELQCFSAQSCIAFGNVPSDQLEEGPGTMPATGVSPTVVLRTQDGGAVWTSTVIPWSATPSGAPAWSNQEHAIFTCSTESTCLGLAVVMGQPDGSGQPRSMLELGSSNGGATWSSSWVPNVQANAGELVCPTESNCYALVNFETGNVVSWGVITTTNGGASWSTTPQPFPSYDGGWGGLTAISCPTDTTCWASGHVQATTNPSEIQGVMYVTQDGGQTWSTATLPSGTGVVHEVDCPSVQSCLAIAQPTGSTFSEVLTNAQSTPT